MEEGQAIVNSDPANWPLILNWLSFGTVPSNPSESLLSECRYWQLDKLLAAIDARKGIDTGISQADAESHCLSIKRASVNGNDGFTVSGLVHNLPKRLSTVDSSAPHVCISFTVAGLEWRLLVNNDEAFSLALLTGPPLTYSVWNTTWGSGPLAVKRLDDSAELFEPSIPLEFDWDAGELKRILHSSTLSLEGSLQLTMTLTFKKDLLDQK